MNVVGDIYEVSVSDDVECVQGDEFLYYCVVKYAQSERIPPAGIEPARHNVGGF
tara:strand:- start:1021 stop:1182 length:162 start_codon:yes stop_codon:yes gene_type:complete